MTDNGNKNNDADIDRARAMLSDAIIERYYHGISMDQVEGYAPKRDHDVVADHFAFGFRRPQDHQSNGKVRVFDALNETGIPTHSVIEVVTNDIPFLVDSVTMMLNRMNVRLLMRIHPVYNVQRDASGHVLDIDPSPTPLSGYQRESFMRFEVQTIATDDERVRLVTSIENTLADVGATSRDRQSIQTRVGEILSSIGDDEVNPDSKWCVGLEEIGAFLEWVAADHFVFLGYINFASVDGQWHPVAESGLGILTDADASRLGRLVPISNDIDPTAPALKVTKAVERSRVHRNGWIDVIVVTEEESGVTTRHAICGLFTSIAYGLRPEAIPYLRSKVDFVMQQSELPVGGFGFRSLRDVLTNYPRDELFQTEPDLLLRQAQEILQVQSRPRSHLLLRHDAERRFYACLVYLPRDRYSREMRIKIEQFLSESFATRAIDYDTHLDTSSLAYIYFRIHDAAEQPDKQKLDTSLREITTEWSQRVETALDEREVVDPFTVRFASGFPTSYIERFSADDAAGDTLRIAKSAQLNSLGVYVYTNEGAGDAGLGLRLYSPETALSLSSILPLIENLGFNVDVERPYEIQSDDGNVVWLHDFSLKARSGQTLTSVADFERIGQAIERTWGGDAENDRFNQLVLFAALDWYQACLVRALCRYLRQSRIAYGENYIVDALERHPKIVSNIVRYFDARFNPKHLGSDSSSTASAVADEINEQLEAVQSLDEDRILRALFNVAEATLRTNYYNEKDEELANALAFKFDSSAIPWLPLPRPMYEIFVYSPSFEGIHLRAGRVARGGLRWSDRREDFRTEVLGLMKAQVVKNAVIVPVGSKGGFIVRRAFDQPPTLDREALSAEVVRCYRAFIASMLAVTDNLVDGEVVPPSMLVRHDDDDPYLVVAADKGTATFSDIANDVSQNQGFWLDDAFASGGRTGYDHKVMGITARGAWESVKRHFRGLGTDVQSERFTVVGIGDMSGDVFGNGMLLSRKICLVAAFNHRHIFIDPDPDPETSFVERKRLFELPRSGWDDYDQSLLSTGGGVYSRSAKSITLSDEARALFAIEAKTIAPTELIHLLLKAPADLLWNGGIGTYVKATAETHEEAADRSSDALRVNGNQVGARVVGEGGNLGLTQLGRIEFSQSGGNCYTDFVDNSAGVHSSDYEVNIKILLNAVVSRGDLDENARNELLASMTDEVATLVLRENYLQTRALAYALHHRVRLFPEQLRLLRALETRGRLDRQIEYLPSNDVIAERKRVNAVLTAPEIAVLQAYAKMELYDELLASPLPDDPWLVKELEDYFPTPLVTRYGADLWQHQLRRELVSTQVTNRLIDTTHAGFVQRLRELSDAEIPEIARAFIIVRELFDIDSHLGRIDALDNKVDAATQYEMMMSFVKLIESAMLRLLSENSNADIETELGRLRNGITRYRAVFAEHISPDLKVRIERQQAALESQGVPTDLAHDTSSAITLASGLEAIRLSVETGVKVDDLIPVYFKINDFLKLDLLTELVDALPAESEWHIAAKARLRAKLAEQKHRIRFYVLARHESIDPNQIESGLSDIFGPEADHIRERIASLTELALIDFPVCTVAVDELSSLGSDVDLKKRRA